MLDSPRIASEASAVCYFDSAWWCDDDFTRDISRHVDTDTGSDTDISPHIRPQSEVFALDVICKFYQQKFGHIILGKL